MSGTEAVKRQSRLGKRPVVIPKGVTVNIGGGKVDVQGPKGKLTRQVPPTVNITRDGDALSVTSDSSGRDAPRLQGLARALLAAMVRGAAEGYETTLELVGTGYRCEVKGRAVHFSLGFSHPTVFELPASLTAVVPPDTKGTRLILTSADRETLGQVAASMRALRPPEPYGGKGVRYAGERIRRKAGKAGKGKAG